MTQFGGELPSRLDLPPRKCRINYQSNRFAGYQDRYHTGTYTPYYDFFVVVRQRSDSLHPAYRGATGQRYKLYIPPGGIRLVCPGCELDFRRELPPQRSSLPPAACWVCGRTDVYAQKDLNPAPWWALPLLGALLVGGTAISVGLSMTVALGAAALAGVSEYLVYRSFSECYACAVCGSVYRGFAVPARPKRRPEGLAPKFHESRRLWLEEILRAQEAGRQPSREGT